MDEPTRSIFHYQFEELKRLFTELISQHTSPETLAWFKEKASTLTTPRTLQTTFAAIPRKTGKAPLQASAQQLESISAARPGLDVRGWTIDRLARTWLLMHIDPSDQAEYQRSVESLFPSADVNELVALYSALPLLAYPASWTARCSEGIRNNIADVLTAIMCNNPYPSENLSESAWNQLVLKAIFTEKPVGQVVGLDRRANKTLAATLSDYAHERWAAHRTVNPLLWRCVAPFIDSALLPDIEKIATSDNPVEKEAAALACYQSSYAPAKELLHPDLRTAIDSGELSWDKLAEKIQDHVLQ